MIDIYGEDIPTTKVDNIKDNNKKYNNTSKNVNTPSSDKSSKNNDSSVLSIIGDALSNLSFE